jgi:putative ABC transport system substrate-binding protein
VAPVSQIPIKVARFNRRDRRSWPGDVPFYQSTRIILTRNLKTAKALGMEIPASLLADADEVAD